jgi:cystathionine beta-lyase/cystathionine gamma-synthase
MKEHSLNTKCVHAGTYVDQKALGINTPIFASSAFIFPNDFDEVRYPRYFNIPTQKAVAEKICALEGGEKALVFSSGLAAISATLFAFLKSGDHAIFQRDLYGGTQNFIARELPKCGIQIDIINSNNTDDYARAIKPNTKLIFFESPTNPLLSIIDLKTIAEIAQKHKILSIIDGTFATPINQNPLALGIDIVIHSGTKYLNGHSDLCAGAVVSSNKLMEQITQSAVNYGGNPDVHACYLLERGLKTLGIRVAQHNKSGLKIAEYLNGHSHVKQVFYPGLPNHTGHNIAKTQMRGFGGMLSFELDCSGLKAHEFVRQLKLVTPAVSLGGVETLLCFPCETSHAKLSPSQRQEQGISDSLIRLSVGIEDVDDLIDDFENAFTAL